MDSSTAIIKRKLEKNDIYEMDELLLRKIAEKENERFINGGTAFEEFICRKGCEVAVTLITKDNSLTAERGIFSKSSHEFIFRLFYRLLGNKELSNEQ